eukprot:GHUV01018356.1.p1 GENE.GHUV01018356.1~~GHUV01018356.1.p1  ORF type:complete len:890 (+),score=363.92 GHUV01018356.1:326-2995(+)
MLQLQRLVAQTEGNAKLSRQQQQGSQVHHATARQSSSSAPAAALPGTFEEQQPKAAAADVQQQQQLLQQQILLRQLLQQQQVRQRRLQLQLRSEPAVLTSLVKRCHSWQHLQHLFNTYTQHFNAVHVSAALTHLAQIQGPISPLELDQQPNGLKQLMRELTSAAAACIPDYGARQLANTIWAISKLGCGSKVPRRLRNGYLTAFMQKLPGAAPQHISNVALAVGNMGWGTSTVWQQNLLQAAESKRQFFKPQELVSLLYALPLLNVQPAQPWLSTWLDACYSSLYHFNSQELAMLGVGLVRLKQQLSGQQLAEYLHAVQLQLDATVDIAQHSHGSRPSTRTAPSTGSSCSGGDAQQDLQQPTQESQQQQQPTVSQDSRLQRPHLAGFQAQGLVNILWALAVWGVKLEPSWQASSLACTKQMLGSCTAKGLSTLLWALTKLQVPVDSTLLAQLLQQAQPLLPTASSTDLALVMWSCGTLGVRCQHSSSSHRAVSSTAAADSSSRGSTAPDWLTDLLYYSRRQLAGASTRDLVSMLVGAVRMHLQPDARWLQAVAAEAHHHLSSMNSMELSSLLLSLTRLRHKPRAAFMAHYCSRSVQLLDQTTAVHSKPRRSSRSRLRHSDRPAADGVGAELYSPQSLANTVGAMAMLHYQPPKAWSRAFLAASEQLLPAFSARDFAYCIWALAMLDIQPPQLWLDEFLVQLRQHIPTMVSSELSATIWAVAKLNHKPGVDWMQRFLDRVVSLTQSSTASEQVGTASSSSSQDCNGSQSSCISRDGEATQVLPVAWVATAAAHKQPVSTAQAPRTPLQLSTDFSSIILHGLTLWATARLEYQGVPGMDHSISSAQRVGANVDKQTASISSSTDSKQLAVSGTAAAGATSVAEDGCIVLHF